jgi:glycerol-3-phosphate dehydrogenase
MDVISPRKRKTDEHFKTEATDDDPTFRIQSVRERVQASLASAELPRKTKHQMSDFIAEAECVVVAIPEKRFYRVVQKSVQLRRNCRICDAF